MPVMPVLDHTAYPHILEKIITFAPHSSLLRLRSVSHNLRGQVDALLASHLVIWAEDQPLEGKPEDEWGRSNEVTKMIVASPVGRIPYFAPLEVEGFKVCWLPNCLRTGCLRLNSDDEPPLPVAKMADLTATTVVDLFGEPVANFVTYTLLKSLELRNNVTIRVQPTRGEALWSLDDMNGGGQCLVVSALVVNMGLVEAFNEPLAGWPWVDAFHLLPRDRAVHNIWYHPEDTLASPRGLAIPVWDDEHAPAYLVFHRAAEPTHREVDITEDYSSNDTTGGYSSDSIMETYTATDLLDYLAEGILDKICHRHHHYKDFHIYIVGTAALAGPWLESSGLSSDDSDEQFLQCLVNLILDSPWPNRELLYRALDRVKFMSLEAYRAERGSVRAALEIDIEHDLRPPILMSPSLRSARGP